MKGCHKRFQMKVPEKGADKGSKAAEQGPCQTKGFRKRFQTNIDPSRRLFGKKSRNRPQQVRLEVLSRRFQLKGQV